MFGYWVAVIVVVVTVIVAVTMLWRVTDDVTVAVVTTDVHSSIIDFSYEVPMAGRVVVDALGV